MAALACALFAAALAGFSRRFAAFGTAMIYVPIVTLAYDAKTAVVTLFLVDLVPSIPLVWRAASKCEWTKISWMALGAVALSLVGVAVLLVIDQRQAQLIVGCIVWAATSYMLFGKGFSIGDGPVRSVGAGAVSGFAGGLCGIFGPPAMIYLLGCSADAGSTRANAIIFLTGESLILGATYVSYGMVTLPLLELSLALAPTYAVCLWFGAKQFSHAGDAAYRRMILGLLFVTSMLIIGRSTLTLPR
jgi:uncharacterized membrane protein YfcA